MNKRVIPLLLTIVFVCYAIVIPVYAADETEAQTKIVPEDGYATLRECAEAHPESELYAKMKNPTIDLSWEAAMKGMTQADIDNSYRWYPITESDYKQRQNAGEYFIKCEPYNVTLEAAVQALPDAVDYQFHEERGWIENTSFDGGYNAKPPYLNKKLGPYSTREEAEAVAASYMGYTYTTYGFDGKSPWQHEVYDTAVHQNPHTGKWFAGYKHT